VSVPPLCPRCGAEARRRPNAVGLWCVCCFWIFTAVARLLEEAEKITRKAA
jgi:ribosomal protein L37AE/L43A